jgi:hypothetical protein
MFQPVAKQVSEPATSDVREQFDQRVTGFLVLRAEQQLQISLAVDEPIFLRGTTLENAHQVLDARPVPLRELPGYDLIRNVAGKGQTLFVSLCRSGEIGIVRNLRLDFDKVHSLLFERVYSLDRDCRSSDGTELGKRSLPLGR